MKVHYLSFKGLVMTLVLALLSFSSLLGQQVTGRVTDSETNELLPGANIIVKNGGRGTTTDGDGKYALTARAGEELVVSLVGYAPQTVTVGASTTIDFALVPDNQLNEVIVTALGISREKKSLGYAAQEVKGDDLVKARETNIINSLSGKVAGLTIVGNPSGIGSSSRITIRGERSLNINRNQPLFVVDGVPISNEFRGNSGNSFQDADYGNGAGFVNPDDVETITVLKGASAAALYGSRANNGVIVITTKSGKGTKGIGVSVNSTVTFEDVLRLPEYQNQYGQGLGGNFEFKDGNGGGTADGVDESWGPAFNGQLIPQFDSPTSNGYRGGDVGNLFTSIGPVNLAQQLATRGNITATPWVARPDNIRDFFETGVTQTHNVALTGSNSNGDFRLSYTWLDQVGTVPNTDLKRNTISFSGGYNLSDRLRVRTAINYLTNTSANRPNLSYGTENIMYLFNCWLGRQVDVSAMRDYWQAGREGLNQFGFNYNYHDNPYFNLYENTNSQNLGRVYGNASITYDFTDNLSLMLRAGTDASNEFRARRRAYSTQRFQRGSYREERIGFTELNTDFLLSYKKNLSKDLDINLGVGGNAMRQVGRFSDVIAPELAVPGIYTLSNSRVALQNLTNTPFTEKRINSLYATGQLGFRNFLYLDLSARNDWSSTLPSDSRSYLYYAANVSAVLTDAFHIKSDVLSFAKIRAGVAQVGNDTDPYQLETIFNAQQAVLGAPSYSESSVLVNANLKPEISTSFETGLDLRFFHNRMGIDFTYYNTQSKNQILPIPLTNTSGYSARIINAGLIENQGIELTFNATPIRKRNFSWDVSLNFSRNRSEVKELFQDPESGQEVTNYVMASRYVTVEARVGEQMGNMYGIGYQRVSSDPSSQYYDPTGQFVGQVVYNSQGKPIRTSSRILLGNYNPDWLGGIGNTFTFKGLSLGVLFDVRVGGEVYSHTQTVGREGGQIIETLEGRANGYDLSLEGNGVVGEGVIKNADGTYSPNTVELSAREWHTTYTLGRSLIEGVIYDASFAKLREVRLGYTLPNRFLKGSSLRDLNVTLVGRNLALWTEVPHIDPETSSTSGGTVIPGVESVALPSTRSWGVNLSFRF
ncbi:MAG TPA: SusC/RagA family TonB-linked outer membrane protein [Saprospirales bacterium]|nr:SusC/RagA family TonB-linked outer membrane protein [Saprospirales bacterium]